MIAVIADDFTGAAEIGGIGLRHGLKVVIETENIRRCNTDLLVIATNTRSLHAKEASVYTENITKQLLKLNPAFIYKKIDSVLRGNIIGELAAMMYASQKKRAIVVAANPVFNRVIRDGIFFIDNIPLKETCFSTDPEYPIHSSSVLEILGKNSSVKNCRFNELLPEEGIIIGDVENDNDLKHWAVHIDAQTLPAGASGFFDALIRKHEVMPSCNISKLLPFGEKALYVLGSTYPKDTDFLKKLEENDHYLSNIPEEIYCNKNYDPKYLEAWANDIVHAIENHKKVIASIFHDSINEPDIAIRISETIGILIKKVTEKTNLNELLLEGGRTTSVVLKHLKINRLIPIQELDTGVIRMKIEGKSNFCVTTKPGSYFWPESILSQLTE
ncbi:MAG: four-carbon acid sugar kinase family protein [Bacteroidota bacterium]|nr:four-carbon acid sugar kinase family protein [Bacteroidota bacterium]MDP4273514.1 four-carbon acid sugar kinase family protein [Bacteroidota bacterium]